MTRRQGLGLLAIVGAALLLRLFRLEWQGYWYDECLSLTMSRQPVADLIREQAASLKANTYPPLHSLLLHFWNQLPLDEPYAARLFSALCGTATVAVMFALMRRLFDRRTALYAAGLLAVSQMAVQYSQETRAYALLLLLCTTATWSLEVSLVERRVAAWWGFVGISAVAVYTHYYAAFTVGALVVYALADSRSRPPWRWWIGGAVAGGLLLAPWLWATTGRLFEVGSFWQSQGVPSWFSVDHRTPFEIAGRFHSAYWQGLAPRMAPRWAQLVGGLLLGVPALVALGWLARAVTRASRGGHPEGGLRPLALLAILAIAATLGPLLMGARGVPFHPRYTFPALAPYLGLVAAGAGHLPRGWPSRLWIAAAVGFCLGSLPSQYLVPAKEQWREPLALLARESRPGDRVVCVPFDQIPLAWQVYHRDVAEPETVSLTQALADAGAPGRTWLLAYTRLPSFGEEAGAAQRRLAERMVMQEHHEYFWTRLSLFQARPDDEPPR